MPKDKREGARDTYEKRRRDTYLTRAVQTTPRDFGDKRNNIPPPNVSKHYKDRSKYDGKGRRKDDV